MSSIEWVCTVLFFLNIVSALSLNYVVKSVNDWFQKFSDINSEIIEINKYQNLIISRRFRDIEGFEDLGNMEKLMKPFEKES